MLVVDDNRDSADALAELLRLGGHEVAVAYSGREALAAGGSFRPEVVLLDLGMPEIDGYETARRLRAQPGGDSLKLVAFTGFGQERERERSRQAGFDHHLVKPVQVEQLSEILAGA